MKIREEFAEFWESVKHAASGFVDWACWRWLEIVVVALIAFTAFAIYTNLWWPQ